MDSILARLDDRLRKFSGTEESGKDGEVGQVEKSKVGFAYCSRLKRNLKRPLKILGGLEGY